MSQEGQQFNITFILCNGGTLSASLVRGTTIDQIINEIKAMEDGLRKEINNNDFRITNLSKGRKFDHVELTHKVEQLGTGELKVKFQQPKQQFIITFILPNGETLPVAADKGTIIDKIIDEMKTTNNLRKEINNIDFRITNLSKGRKFDHVKLTHKVEQLGTGELKVKFQQPTQLQKGLIEMTFSINGTRFTMRLNKEERLKDILEQLKTQLNKGQLSAKIEGNAINNEQTVFEINNRYENTVIQLTQSQAEILIINKNELMKNH